MKMMQEGLNGFETSQNQFFRSLTTISDFEILIFFEGSRSHAATSNQVMDESRKEELLLEIQRLRERIKCLETDNASMHTKLSKTQKDVNQRLTEIEMQIADDQDFSFENPSPPDEDEEEEENNRESFI